MERRSSSDSERTISDSSKQKRKREDGTTSTGFGSGLAGRHHLRFTGTATIHLNLDIESLSKEIEQRQGIAAQRHEEHDLELRLGPPPAQRETRDSLAQFGRTPDQIFGRQQSEVSQASSSHQSLRRQEQGQREAFHIAQPHQDWHQEISHQETRLFSQQEVIDGKMHIEISSDSDSEPNHSRPLLIRETDHERIHHQAGSSNLVMHDSIRPLDQIPWYRIIKAQRDKAYDQAGPSRQADALPARAKKIEQLIAKLSERYGKHESWRNAREKPGDIRYDIAHAKMNKEEYEYARQIVTSTIQDPAKKVSIRNSLRVNYTNRER
jgi:hypothetical protein